MKYLTQNLTKPQVSITYLRRRVLWDVVDALPIYCLENFNLVGLGLGFSCWSVVTSTGVYN